MDLAELRRHWDMFGETDFRAFDAWFDFVPTIIVQHRDERLARHHIRELVRVPPPAVRPAAQPVPLRDEVTNASAVPWTCGGSPPPSRPVEEDEPRMEMHSVPKSDVIRLVRASGARVVEVDRDNACGRSWEGYRYYVQMKVAGNSPKRAPSRVIQKLVG